jgi:hypothetical protein
MSASITFKPDGTVATHLTKLSQITQLPVETLINALLASPLEQIIGGGDTGFLRSCIDPFQYKDQKDALAVIDGYNCFIAELKAAGSKVYLDHAAPARTRDGHWEIIFQSTDPRPDPILGDTSPDDRADWWKSDKAGEAQSS